MTTHPIPVKVRLTPTRIRQLCTQGFADSIRFRYYLPHPQLDPLHCTQPEFNPFLVNPFQANIMFSEDHIALRIPFTAVLGLIPATHKLAQPEYVKVREKR